MYNALIHSSVNHPLCSSVPRCDSLGFTWHSLSSSWISCYKFQLIFLFTVWLEFRIPGKYSLSNKHQIYSFVRFHFHFNQREKSIFRKRLLINRNKKADKNDKTKQSKTHAKCVIRQCYKRLISPSFHPEHYNTSYLLICYYAHCERKIST